MADILHRVEIRESRERVCSAVTEEDGRKAVWTCKGGVDDWVGTRFSFNIEPTDGGSVLRFKNSGWAEASDFYAHCNCKWGFFLGVSLKNYLETGKGSPAPEDPGF